MPRKPRFVIPGVPLHVVQRGHSRGAVFFEDADCSAYLNWLKDAADRYRCAIHAYVLMTNHIHILATPADTEGVTRLTTAHHQQHRDQVQSFFSPPERVNLYG